MRDISHKSVDAWLLSFEVQYLKKKCIYFSSRTSQSLRDEPLSLKRTQSDDAHSHMNGHLVNGFASAGNDSSDDSDDDMPLELPPSPKVLLFCRIYESGVISNAFLLIT